MLDKQNLLLAEEYDSVLIQKDNFQQFIMQNDLLDKYIEWANKNNLIDKD